jgi:hypothetical protein
MPHVGQWEEDRIIGSMGSSGSRSGIGSSPGTRSGSCGGVSKGGGDGGGTMGSFGTDMMIPPRSENVGNHPKFR